MVLTSLGRSHAGLSRQTVNAVQVMKVHTVTVITGGRHAALIGIKVATSGNEKPWMTSLAAITVMV
jgi:hypothetical protein